MDDQKIKLIWDFRGPTAHEVARHHQEHLKEYIASEEGLSIEITGYKDLSSLHSLAFMVVEESQMPRVRDALRPHRGEIYEELPE
jgi:hypothetical protein